MSKEELDQARADAAEFERFYREDWPAAYPIPPAAEPAYAAARHIDKLLAYIDQLYREAELLEVGGQQ